MVKIINVFLIIEEFLFWKPHVEVEGTDLHFEFYTSDLTGEFEVVLDGFTTYGKPISVYKTFIVKEESQ